MNIILSIRPNFCLAIFEGTKLYEYRKKVFKHIEDVDKVYIYATRPISMIVGYFTISKMIEGLPVDVWEMTHEVSGITKEFFDAYFNDCSTAHAIAIDKVVKFDTPIDPKKVIKNFTAPQNYMYLERDLQNYHFCVRVYKSETMD